MAENSKISWTDHTANLWWGCTKVHTGCDNCYAEYQSDVMKRGLKGGGTLWGPHRPRRAIKSFWSDLQRYQQMAAAAGEIHRVFVGSMMDIFEKTMPLVDRNGEVVISPMMEDEDLTGFRREDFQQYTGDDRAFFLREVVNYPNLLFLLLTKRPSNINKMIPEAWKVNPPENVMFGTSIVDQATADKLVPQLLEVKGYHFLSIEPQIDGIALNPDWLAGGSKIDWVIQGGESGHNARAFTLGWAGRIMMQCENRGVPYFFKQTGAFYAKRNGFTHDKSHGANPLDWPEWLRVQQLPNIPILNT